MYINFLLYARICTTLNLEHHTRSQLSLIHIYVYKFLINIISIDDSNTVSYTHLDVYKRQEHQRENHPYQRIKIPDRTTTASAN